MVKHWRKFLSGVFPGLSFMEVPIKKVQFQKFEFVRRYIHIF